MRASCEGRLPFFFQNRNAGTRVDTIDKRRPAAPDRHYTSEPQAHPRTSLERLWCVVRGRTRASTPLTTLQRLTRGGASNRDEERAHDVHAHDGGRRDARVARAAILRRDGVRDHPLLCGRGLVGDLCAA